MNVKAIIGIILVFLFGCFIGYGYGVYYNGATADEVRGQLEGTQTNQRTITEGLGSTSSKVKRAGAIIDECQYILQRVRSQPASETKKN